MFLGEEAIWNAIPVRVRVRLADDMLTAITMVKESNLKLVLDCSTEEHGITGILAKEGIPAVVEPLALSEYKVELRNQTIEIPAILARSGVQIAITTGPPSNTDKATPIPGSLSPQEGSTI